MRRLLCAAILATALGLTTASSASAWGSGSTEFGNTCVGNATAPGITAIGLDNARGPIPKNVGPWELRGGGPGAVITRWKAQLGPGIGPLAQQLVAFKQGEPQLLVGESAVETLVEGTSEFATRIPIPEYAQIGLRGPLSTLFCADAVGEFAGIVEGPWPVGEARAFETRTDTGVPAIAIAERDADGDGYGDLTQDKCTTTAEYHDPCPSVSIESHVAALERGAILIGVTVNVSTRVHVRGQVSWPLPRKRGQAGRAKERPLRTVDLDAGIQDLAAGVPAVFRVPLPKPVTKQLRRMRPAQRLKATMLVGRLDRLTELPGVVNRVLVVKLPGRERKHRR